MLKIYSISLGCPKNRVDTERLLGAMGPLIPVDRPDLADLALVNTCAFIEPAVRESVRVILEQAEILKGLSGRRPLLAVAGCLPGRYGRASLAGDLPEVDLWLETRRMSSWPELISE
ncbi:MAG: 30S ribosomal protein S12 methylthiotransferase RimO, partial [Desulfovibrionaceae bacterium]|nr:30S ribosomal protein S12 methylthiotransferase RimO [Desulfovibrionaceae bacterium]